MFISYGKIIILILFALNTKLKVNAFSSADGESQQTDRRIVKRGYSGGGGDSGNNWGPPVHITSTVLQLQHNPSQSEANASPHYDPSLENAWKLSGITPGYEVWLETDAGLQHYQPIQSIHGSSVGSVSGNHLGNAAGGNVFSAEPHVVSGLHTQITSSAPTERTLHVIDNVDFHNVADLKDSRYSKSYGR